MKTIVFIILSLFALCYSTSTFAVEGAVHVPSRTPSNSVGGSQSCLRCHSGEKMRTVSNSSHGDTELERSPISTYGCESCHGPGSIHISRAHGGRGFPALTKFGRRKSHSPREEQLNGCLHCHADEGMGEKQIIFPGSTHDNGKTVCSHCHKIHAEFNPVKNKKSLEKTCARCHRSDIKNHPKVVVKGLDFDLAKCSDCHNIHAPAKPKE